jgi:hypothetical protein
LGDSSLPFKRQAVQIEKTQPQKKILSAFPKGKKELPFGRTQSDTINSHSMFAP